MTGVLTSVKGVLSVTGVLTSVKGVRSLYKDCCLGKKERCFCKRTTVLCKRDVVSVFTTHQMRTTFAASSSTPDS